MTGNCRELASRERGTWLLLFSVHHAVVNVDFLAFLREGDLDTGLRIQIARGRLDAVVVDRGRTLRSRGLLGAWGSL